MACIFEPPDQQGTAHPTEEQQFLTRNVGLAGSDCQQLGTSL